MKWRRVGRSQVEDRRGMGGSMPLGVGGGLGGLGLVGLLIYLVLASGVFGGGGGGIDVGPSLDPFPAMQPERGSTDSPDPDDRLKEFVNFVVVDVQDSWQQTFQRAGETYDRTVLVLFEGGVQTDCGNASSATGPFYCSLDRKVYLDLSFFRELRDRFAAPGDFAQAYVIAHEFGHHVQNLLGVMEDVRRSQEDDPEAANDLSIALELQADCLAGVWGSTARAEGLLERGDLEEGLAAAAAVGDDRIQQQATGRIDQESWTHGSSQQRVEWFRRGFDSGEPGTCDTFS